MYATLNDSYQWNQINHNGAMNAKLKSIMDNGIVVTMDKIPSAMLQFKNRIKSPISSNIINRMERGDIVLMYAPDIKIPVYLPYIITKINGDVKGIVFVNNLDASTEKGEGYSSDEIFLNARKLKVALESCFISLCLREMGNSPKTRSTTIIKSGSRIYSSLMTECINRKHSIKLDQNVFNSLTYIFSRYFIGTIVGCRDSIEPDVMRNYCLYNCNNADVVSMNRIMEHLEDSDFDNIATLMSKIKVIPEFNKRLGDITTANLIESFVNMYNASMLLSLEVFDYFMYNVFSVIDSTYVNNYPVMKNIVSNDGRKLYSDLIVAVSNL